MKKVLKDFCKKHKITEKQFYGKEEISDSLDLRSLTSIPKGFNPIIGGWLDLSSLTSLPEGFNPTVGGSLYLRSLISIPEGFNPTVGDWLDLRSGLTCNYKKMGENKLLTWCECKYILADGIFTEVIKHKNGIYHLKKIGENKITYLINKDDKFSHGETLQQAKEDLIYKIGNRDKTEYNDLNLDSVLSFEEAIQCYRIVTGSCSFGVKSDQ